MCVRFALVCCALRVDFIKSLRLTNTVIIIIIITFGGSLSLGVSVCFCGHSCENG